MTSITEDDILRAAEQIKRHRLLIKRKKSAEEAKSIMIRWDIPGAPFGESYGSVNVTYDDIKDIIDKKFDGEIHNSKLDIFTLAGNIDLMKAAYERNL